MIYVQKLIHLLSGYEEDPKLTSECLQILAAIILLDDAPLDSMAEKLNKRANQLTDAEKTTLKV